MTATALPESFADEAALDDFLATPQPGVAADLARAPGDIIVLGVAGKMGPTLAMMAKRADPRRRVIGVARFTDRDARQRLEAAGVECIPADLLDRAAVARLPQMPNLVFMAGRKFGSTGAEHLTWAINTLAPAFVAEHFRAARWVVFSTGCVYPFADVGGPGASEETPLLPPPGEYAASCVGRERIFDYFSQMHGNAGRIFRLNYAIDLRYGVLHDVATKVRDGMPIDLATGQVNVIWQGDACARALRCLGHATAPMTPINVSGSERLSIRHLAEDFGRLFGRPPVFAGREMPNAWLVDCRRSVELFGPPVVPLERMIRWTADWLRRGMPSFGKPTHYETRDGAF
jgi:nucleoside-diphosphate-sugar epimerase